MNDVITSRRRRVLASILLPLILLAALVAFWPRADAAALTGHEHVVGVAVGPGSPQVADAPTSPPVEPGAPPSRGGPPETSLEAAASTDPGDQRNNAALPGKRGAIDPDDVLVPSLFGGCLAEYGENGQCLTTYPPSLGKHVREMVDAGLDPSTMPHNWSCAEVQAHFPDGITVRVPGVDPQKLDADSDGTACEPD